MDIETATANLETMWTFTATRKEIRAAVEEALTEFWKEEENN